MELEDLPKPPERFYQLGGYDVLEDFIEGIGENELMLASLLALYNEEYLQQRPVPQTKGFKKLVKPEVWETENHRFWWRRHAAYLLGWQGRRQEGEGDGFTEAINKLLRKYWPKKEDKKEDRGQATKEEGAAEGIAPTDAPVAGASRALAVDDRAAQGNPKKTQRGPVSRVVVKRRKVKAGRARIARLEDEEDSPSPSVKPAFIASDAETEPPSEDDNNGAWEQVEGDLRVAMATPEGTSGGLSFGAAMAARRSVKKAADKRQVAAASLASVASVSVASGSAPRCWKGRLEPSGSSPVRTRGEELVRKPEAYSPGMRVVGESRGTGSVGTDNRVVKRRLVSKTIGPLYARPTIIRRAPACRPRPRAENDAPSMPTGNRIVSMKLMADFLETTCSNCEFGGRLRLIGEDKKMGLASRLLFECACGKSYSFETTEEVASAPGVRGRKARGINYQAIVGAIATGSGLKGLQKLMGCLNVPSSGHDAFDAAMEKVIEAMEILCDRSFKEAIDEVIRRLEENGEVPLRIVTEQGKEASLFWAIAATFDGGWPKRGTRSGGYNSLGGMAALMSALTGKVLQVEVLNTRCGICDQAEDLKTEPPDHRCHRNYADSAKSMEPEGGVRMLERITKFGCVVRDLIGDADSSVMAAVRERLPPWIANVVEKALDIGHLKGNLYDKMTKLKASQFKKDRKAFTDGQIRAVSSYFAAAILSNRGDRAAVKQALESIVPHLFNEHDKCKKKRHPEDEEGWCKAGLEPDHVPNRLKNHGG
ncbi:hypothetical protein KFL_001650040 [Klebsormidium nitens]|uniref:Mutator-like transposase domain-containing protein n=1 Tax=Klebsormidium nitens TaxID=105231 RepID=A0A1Y1I1L7_KLENI|nr:hypothetical protein KFL_001650040 [Klebsormidium nitens]|eukprot:GAQ83852.1 hypothetical protein KFL_001650040 [Klebsormidium nitens]